MDMIGGKQPQHALIGAGGSTIDGFMQDEKNKKKLDPYHFYAGETYG